MHLGIHGLQVYIYCWRKNSAKQVRKAFMGFMCLSCKKREKILTSINFDDILHKYHAEDSRCRKA